MAAGILCAIGGVLAYYGRSVVSSTPRSTSGDPSLPEDPRSEAATPLRITLKIVNDADPAAVQARVAVFRGAWHIPTLLETDPLGLTTVAGTGERLRVLACRFVGRDRFLWAEKTVEADFAGDHVEIHFRSLSALTARVVDERGAAIGEMSLRITLSYVGLDDRQVAAALPYLANGNLPALDVRTDSTGGFALAQLPGEFRLNLGGLFSPSRVYTWSFESDMSQWGNFWFSPPRPGAYTLVIRRARNPELGLRVLDAARLPVPEASLLMLIERPGRPVGPPEYGRTAQDGTASIPVPLWYGEPLSAVAGSRLWIVAWHAERGWATMGHTFAPGGLELQIQLRTPESGAQLRGVVVDSRGTPLSGCLIMIKSTLQFQCEARTHESGEFLVKGFPRIPVGWPEELRTPEYEIRVDHPSENRALLFKREPVVPVLLDTHNRLQADPD